MTHRKRNPINELNFLHCFSFFFSFLAFSKLNFACLGGSLISLFADYKLENDTEQISFNLLMNLQTGSPSKEIDLQNLIN